MMGGETKTKTKITIKKILSIIGNVLLYLILAIAVFVLIVSVTAKKDVDGTATVFGKQLRFVQSDSMGACEQTDVSAYKIKSIKIKSCVFIDVIPEDETEKEEWLKTIKAGDVLTFKYVYTKQVTITHRVVNIEVKETGGYIITLEGDNKAPETAAGQQTVGRQTIDTSQDNSQNYIIGRVTGQSYLLGLLVYAFKQPVGIVCFLLVPCLIMIAFQVMRIVGAVSSDKRERAAEKEEARTSEIEELKRKLAELQQSVGHSESLGNGETVKEQQEQEKQAEQQSIAAEEKIEEIVEEPAAEGGQE